MFVAPLATWKRRSVFDEGLDAFPRSGRQNSGVFPWVRRPLVRDRARIHNVGQKPPERAQREWRSRAKLTRLARPAFERQPRRWISVSVVRAERCFSNKEKMARTLSASSSF